MGLNLDQIKNPATRRQIMEQDARQNARQLSRTGTTNEAPPTGGGNPAPVSSPKKRIMQRIKPLMNKLETRFSEYLAERYPSDNWHPQAVTLKLANGLRYYPDFVNFNLATVYEVKGEWIDGDSIPKLKMAASVYPELNFILVSWDKKVNWWNFEHVLA